VLVARLGELGSHFRAMGYDPLFGYTPGLAWELEEKHIGSSGLYKFLIHLKEFPVLESAHLSCKQIPASVSKYSP
jgi:hypothetical protein